MKTRLILLSTLSLLLTGCSANMQTTEPISRVIPPISGKAFGGQQPIVGAEMHMYAAGTSGYGLGSQDLMSQQVLTVEGGNFTLTGMYTCTPGQQVYLVALGGNPGAGVNANSVLAAALGDCVTLTPSTFILLNEVTTVAAAYALAPFATNYAGISTSPTNTAGLQRAFTSAAKLANTAVGRAGGVVPQGATVPVAEINSLANILAACVNTAGNTGPSTPCGQLFSLSAVNGNTPADTFAAALSIARNPANNAAALLDLISPQSPFAPSLATAPHDWSVAIVYSGFRSPSTTTIDASGQIWIANAGNNTVTVLAQTGTPATGSPFSGNGLANPSAIAIDPNGNAWVANKSGSTVSAFTSTGVAFGASPFSVGTAPSALAFGMDGHLFVSNQSSNSVSELAADGSSVRTYTTGVLAPGAVVVNPK